jgi:BTB/POZ domain
VYELDTDPCPEFEFKTKTNAPERLMNLLADQRNKPDFSDVTFLVQGRQFFAHRIIVAQLSEKFRTMLTAGFQESQVQQIKIDDISYEVFSDLMTYLYTGRFEALDKECG